MAYGRACSSLVALFAAACAGIDPGDIDGSVDGDRVDLDAGLDAGPADAEPHDSGANDAGALDASVAEAGPGDAGAAEAGPADAGAAEAGPADAAAGDAGTDGGHGDGGVDGGPEPAIVYVTPSGDDALDGRSVADAVQTLPRALALAATCDPEPCAVHTAQGSYLGPIDLRSGVSLIGGFSDDFTEVVGRSVISRATVTGVPFVHTIRGTAVQGVRIAHFDLQGADLSTLGPSPGSVVTLWLYRSTDVVLEDVTIHGGNARQAQRGENGASGLGRSSTGCAARGEGRRQTSGCQEALSGTSGATSTRLGSGAGSSGAGGGRSGCSNAHCPPSPPTCDNGGSASTGGHGTPGPDGMWAPHEGWGTLNEYRFLPSNGPRGADGGDGGGGGGGGEGGDRYAPWCLCRHGVGQGGQGGHGGRGGCGGNGGRGGRSGGASFGVVVDASTLTFGPDVTLIGGQGGRGGYGGFGGSGQDGFTGQGGGGPSGDTCGSETTHGCNGGRGGNGGNGARGGDGAGGDGGPSVLIARRAGGSVLGAPTFVPGTGGARPSGDTSGAVDGPTANIRTY